MNFIKKKIKGSKKGLHVDDDDFDPNQLFPSTAQAPEGAPKGWVPYEERLDEESEEWLAFKQLTSRVSETLQKTQDNLTQIVAHSAVPEGTTKIKVGDIEDEDTVVWINSEEDSPSVQKSASAKAPPRPPPPKHNAPPRPPPPKADSGGVEDILGLSFENGTSNGFPTVPPPDPFAQADEFSFTVEECGFEDDDDDFGIPPLNEDGDDPFDTSFVDVQTSKARSQVRARPRPKGRDKPGDISISRPSVPACTANLISQASPPTGLEDDPFVYSEELGVTNSSQISEINSSGDSPDGKMNAPLPQLRTKSPNPFLSDSPPGEPSATNPFLNGSIFSGVVPQDPLDLLGGGGSVSGNPFSTTANDSANVFGGGSAPLGKRPSLVDDLFNTSNVSYVPNPPSNLDPFGDLEDFGNVDSTPAAIDLLGFTEEVPTEKKVPQSENFDVFSSSSGVPVSGNSKESSIGSRKGSLFGTTTTDIWAENAYELSKAVDASDSAFDSSQFGSRRDSAAVGPVADQFDVFGSVMETTTTSPPKANVFDALDSVLHPMNTFDGLPPAQPKVRIEIPVELKQNADVFEALGQRGPKTPVEPLDMFDPPTPLPDNDEDMFASMVSQHGAEVIEDLPKQLTNESEPMDIEVDNFMTDEDTKQEEVFKEDCGVSITVDEVMAQPEEMMSDNADASPPKPDASSIDEAAFDEFEARFQSTTLAGDGKEKYDPFGGSGVGKTADGSQGFGLMDEFDPFLSLTEPPAAPQPSPAKLTQLKMNDDDDSDSSDSGPDFSIFIKPKMRDQSEVAPQLGPPPVLAPPPKSPARSPAHFSMTPGFNPFDATSGEFGDEFSFGEDIKAEVKPQVPPDLALPELKEVTKEMMERTESQESPGSPLFDEDDTEPLEDFPAKYTGNGWAMVLRQPNKKKITGQRFWKKIFVRLSDHVLHLFNSADDKDPFQELPLQACYSISEVTAQQFDQYGKVFTVKLQYIFYRERVGVRPGQISKVAHGQITSFGQLAKLGLPLEHAPQVSQLLKLGSQDYEDIKVFSREIEDALFRLTVHRDRALTYKTEEIQVTVHDETYADVSKTGHVDKQVARVRVFFLAFISGMPDVEVGLNDILKKGKEVVGRCDIIPVVTEEWIRLENLEFHSCVNQADFDKTRNIKLHPPDACFFELLRFRIRPPKNRELPLQVRAVMTVAGNRVELRLDVLVPGYSGRRHGQVPCEDIAIRFLLPECWIYLFRVEKHFRYGSLKSAARKPGKIKGLERLMGAANTQEASLIEVSTGQAKYEHHHRSIVWRVPRLPKEGQGAYTEHSFLCRFELTSYDQMPEELAKYVYVEFTMPASTISHTTVRSVSVSNQNPPEKHVRYVAKHEYRVEIEHVKSFAENEYVSAAAVTSSPSTKEAQRPPSAGSASPSL